LNALLRAGLEKCDLLGSGGIAQRHVLDVKHGVVAKVRMVVPMLRDQVIDLTLKRGPPSDKKGAQHFRPSLVCLVFHE
jgi:hypothetical protein